MDRTNSIPFLRGIDVSEGKERDNAALCYSAQSYAAQYGITLEDALDCGAPDSNSSPLELNKPGRPTHGQVVKIINGMMARDPELARKAINLD